MNRLSQSSAAPAETPRAVRTPTEFSGVIDEQVISDVHHLFRRRAKRREALMLVLGITSIGVGTFAAYFADGNPRVLLETLRSFVLSLVFFSGWWSLRKGWARYMLDQVISGRIHGAGIVVDQLDDRAIWDDFCSARLSDSAALLFVDEKEKTPSVIALDGLPLHRTFFESEEDWQNVYQLIREQVRNVSLVAKG